MSCKSGKEECQARSVLQECQVRVFQKSVKQECQIRVSCKSVLPERSAIVSGKGVRQECHLSVSSQCVPQVGSLEIVTNKYYIFVSQHTCRHSGSWASSCFFFFTKIFESQDVFSSESQKLFVYRETCPQEHCMFQYSGSQYIGKFLANGQDLGTLKACCCLGMAFRHALTFEPVD